MTERLRFETTVLDLDSIQLRDVIPPRMVIFAISTTGQGEMPQNARKFWKTLLSGALKPGVLRKLRFSSFGLGDSSYAQYNVAHRMLHGRLVQLGADSFCERGEGNEQHPEGHSAGFREWIVKLKERLKEVFPLSDGQEPLPDEFFIEPKWRLALDDVRSDEGKVSTSTGHGEAPSSTLLPLKDSFRALIEHNDRITAKEHFQDVRLLDLRVQEDVPYGPGAVAVIYPKNFPEDVENFIKLMEWEDFADQPLKLATYVSPSGKIHSPLVPSPLRHLDLTSVSLTLRWLLENVLDIMSIPRRTFFAELAHFAGDSNEDEAYQKERLLELANPELIDELWDYTTRPKRTILEVMMDFTTIRIPWEYALSLIPIMRGRQFSIASGGALKQDEDGRTRVQLLIAIVDPPSPIIKWRRRYGVCTRYVTCLQEHQQINISIQPGYLDVQPSELQVPIIMIGPGTGLAPMRSMIHERMQWAGQRETLLGRSKALEEDILFFGCRAENADHFFHDEWEQFQSHQGLSVFSAFSRDKSKPRQYVQDQIRAQGSVVCDALLNRDGKVYVCGSSGNMPKGVRQAILDALVAHSGSLSAEQAEAYLDGMEKGGRYKQETW